MKIYKNKVKKIFRATRDILITFSPQLFRLTFHSSLKVQFWALEIRRKTKLTYPYIIYQKTKLLYARNSQVKESNKFFSPKIFRPPMSLWFGPFTNFLRVPMPLGFLDWKS